MNAARRFAGRLLGSLLNPRDLRRAREEAGERSPPARNPAWSGVAAAAAESEISSRAGREGAGRSFSASSSGRRLSARSIRASTSGRNDGWRSSSATPSATAVL